MQHIVHDLHKDCKDRTYRISTGRTGASAVPSDNDFYSMLKVHFRDRKINLYPCLLDQSMNDQNVTNDV